MDLIQVPMTLVLLVLLALAFDFMNGFHDAANSIATVVSTNVLKPWQAVLWAAAFNVLAWAVFHLAVAATVGKGIVEPTFVDSRVIGTVRSRAAVPDVPLTLRLRLVGEGNREMNTINFISDWQRGFSLDRGRRVASGPALKRGTHSGGC